MAFGDLTTGQKRFEVSNPSECKDRFLGLVAKCNRAQHGDAIIRLKQDMAPGTYERTSNGGFNGNF